jgi:hypothetical protein
MVQESKILSQKKSKIDKAAKTLDRISQTSLCRMSYLFHCIMLNQRCPYPYCRLVVLIL